MCNDDGMRTYTAKTQTTMIRACFGLLAGILSSYSLCFSASPVPVPGSWRYIVSCLIIAFLVFLSVFRQDKITFAWESVVLSSALAVFMLTGNSYALFDDGRLFTAATTVPTLIGYGLLFFFPISLIVNESASRQQTLFSKIRVKLPAIPHPMLFSAVLIVISWLFYIVVLFPGIAYYDGLWQLSQFYGFNDSNLQHPFLATIIMGAISLVGLPLGSTGQFAIYTLLQTGIAIWLLSFLSAYLYRLPQKPQNQNLTDPATNQIEATGGTASWLAFTLFAMINPLLPIYSMSIVKDVPYALSITCLTIMIFDKVSEKNIIPTRAYYSMLIAALVIVVSFRNEGVLIAFIALCILLANTLKAKRRSIAIPGGIIIVSALICTTLIFPHFLGMQQASKMEILAIPLQQVSRDISRHPDSFTPDEKEQINSMLKPGVSIEDLGQHYNSGSIDSVKTLFHGRSFSTKRFLPIWARHLKLHPVTYVSAMVASTYGFVYPFRTDPAYGSLFDLFQWFAPETRHLWHDTWLRLPADVLSPAPTSLEPQQSWLIEQCRKLYATPLLNLILKPGTYVWIGLIAATVIIRRKRWKMLLSFIPLFLILGMCFLSPINENIRYMLPLVFATPFLLIAAVQHQHDDDNS